MLWLKKYKIIMIVAVCILITGAALFWLRRQARVVRVARLVCLTQYDDMMSEMDTATPVGRLLMDSRDAYCDCFAEGIDKNWKKYSLMGTEKMVAEIMNDGEELSIMCIDVFADFVNPGE